MLYLMFIYHSLKNKLASVLIGIVNIWHDKCVKNTSVFRWGSLWARKWYSSNQLLQRRHHYHRSLRGSPRLKLFKAGVSGTKTGAFGSGAAWHCLSAFHPAFGFLIPRALSSAHTTHCLIPLISFPKSDKSPAHLNFCPKLWIHRSLVSEYWATFWSRAHSSLV